MCKFEPDKIICSKKDNPLIVGLGQGENYIASDIPAILSYTRKTYIMNDGEIAIVMKDNVWVTDLEGKPISKKVFEVNWDAEAAEKGGFEHFMLKEIYEQPKAIKDTMSCRITKDGKHVHFEELNWTPEDVNSIGKILITLAVRPTMPGSWPSTSLKNWPASLSKSISLRNTVIAILDGQQDPLHRRQPVW